MISIRNDLGRNQACHGYFWPFLSQGLDSEFLLHYISVPYLWFSYVDIISSTAPSPSITCYFMGSFLGSCKHEDVYLHYWPMLYSQRPLWYSGINIWVLMCGVIPTEPYEPIQGVVHGIANRHRGYSLRSSSAKIQHSGGFGVGDSLTFCGVKKTWLLATA